MPLNSNYGSPARPPYEPGTKGREDYERSRLLDLEPAICTQEPANPLAELLRGMPPGTMVTITAETPIPK